MKNHPKGSPSHEEIMAELKEHFAPVFESSPDGVYIWLDETHMACNEKLAKMFGYTVDEVSRKAPFLETFVHKDDQENFSQNYQRSVAILSYPVTFRFRARRKDGSIFRAETDMIPLSFHGHQIAYHFVRALD